MKPNQAGKRFHSKKNKNFRRKRDKARRAASGGKKVKKLN